MIYSLSSMANALRRVMISEVPTIGKGLEDANVFELPIVTFIIMTLGNMCTNAVEE